MNCQSVCIILFQKSRSFHSCIWQHLYKSMHDKSCVKTRVHRSFTLLMWWVFFFNRNWPYILYQDPTCRNAPTLRFKWDNPYVIITAILLHVSMHVLPIFFSGWQIDSKKNILQWRTFSVWEEVPVTRLGTRGINTLHHQFIIHHTCTFLFI